MQDQNDTIDIPLEISKSLTLIAESKEIQDFIQSTIASGEFEAYTTISDGKEIGFFFDMDGGFLGTKEEVNDIKYGAEIIFSDSLMEKNIDPDEINPILEDVLKNLSYKEINETTFRDSSLGKLGFIFSFHPFACKLFVGTEKESKAMLKALKRLTQIALHPENALRKEQRAKKKTIRKRKKV